MFDEIMECADREILFQHLTVKALQDIESVLEAYNKGDIDYIEPRDENGEPDYSGDFELVIKNPEYEEIGVEMLVMKWVDDHESTDFLVECMSDSICYPAACGIVN